MILNININVFETDTNCMSIIFFFNFDLKVMSLKQRGIRAEYMGSSQTDSTVQSRAESGQFDILYMTPEKACVIPVRYFFSYTSALVHVC